MRNYSSEELREELDRMMKERKGLSKGNKEENLVKLADVELDIIDLMDKLGIEVKIGKNKGVLR